MILVTALVRRTLVSLRTSYFMYFTIRFCLFGFPSNPETILVKKHSVHFHLKRTRRLLNISHKLCRAASPGPPHGYLHQNKQFIEFLLLNGEWWWQSPAPAASCARSCRPIRVERVGGRPIRGDNFCHEIFATPECSYLWLGVTKHFIIVLNLNYTLAGNIIATIYNHGGIRKLKENKYFRWESYIIDGKWLL